MSVKDFLTNEKVNQRFDNPFSLVNYAIKLARKEIERGNVDSSNLSSEILDSIVDETDLIIEEIEVEKESPSLENVGKFLTSDIVIEKELVEIE